MDSPTKIKSRSLSQPCTPSKCLNNENVQQPENSNLFLSPTKGTVSPMFDAATTPTGQTNKPSNFFPSKFPTTPTSHHSTISMRSNSSAYGHLLKSPIRKTPGASPSTTSSMLSSPQYTPPRSGEYQDRFIPARTPRSARIRLDFSDTDQGPLSMSPFQQNLNLLGSDQNRSGSHNQEHVQGADGFSNDPIVRHRVISAGTAPSSSVMASNITSNLNFSPQRQRLRTPERQSNFRQESLTLPNQLPGNRNLPSGRDRGNNGDRRRQGSGNNATSGNGAASSSNSNNNGQSNSSSNSASGNMAQRNVPQAAASSISQQQTLVDEQHFVASRLFRNSRRNLYSNAVEVEQRSSSVGVRGGSSQVSNIVDQFNIKVNIWENRAR